MPNVSGSEMPAVIDRIDTLGREESSESTAKKVYRNRHSKSRGGPSVQRFKPPKNSNKLSVNRLGYASEAEMSEIGVRHAAERGKSFWGWYVLHAGDVKDVGCTVEPSPALDNQYHADIVIPVALDAKERREDLIEYARDLAYRASFRPWGDWIKVEELVHGD